MSDTVVDRRLEQFKEDIRFAELDPVRPIDDGIIVDSESPQISSTFTQHGWVADENDFYAVGSQLAMRSLSFTKDQQTLLYDITVSSSGEDHVRELLLQIASSNQPTEIQFIRGPDDLGDLCICLPPNPMYQNIIWIQHNVLSKLVMYSEQFEDALEVARELSKVLSKGQINDLSSRLPVVESAEASPSRIAVGEETNIQLVLPDDSDDQIDVEFVPPDSVLETTFMGDLSAKFTGVQVGTSSVGIYVTNTRTLLMKVVQIPIEVIPKKESEQ